MQTKPMHRFVAAALAIVMVLLMVPVSPITAEAATNVYTLDASADLAAFASGEKATGDTDTAGTDNFFTLYWSEKSKVDGSKKTFSDGYQGTQRLNFNATMAVDGTSAKNAAKFTTEGPASVKVWWVCGGDGRQVNVVKEDGSLYASSFEADGASVKNDLYISQLQLKDAGTYYLGGADGNNLLFKIQVTVTTEDAPVETTAATTAATTEATTEATTVPETTAATTVPETSAPTVPETTPATEPATEPTAPAYTEGLVDVWDFGAEQLDSTKYNNMLNEAEINSWFPGIEPGTAGTPLLGFTSTDGQLVFEANGKTNNRLRTTNEKLCRHDSKSLTDVDGVVYSGYVYSNSSKTDKVYLALQVEAGDIVTVVVGSNGGDSEISFEGPNGIEDAQTFLASGAKAQIMTFYPAESGMYKFYSLTEKLVIARIYREHTDKVPVSGAVTAPAELTGYGIRFINQSNGAVAEASVENGTYAVELNEGFTYDVELVDANGYIITSEKTLTVAKDAESVDLPVQITKVDLVTVTGNITGLSEEALSKLVLTFEADTVYVPEVTVTGTAYSVELETGVTYAVVASGVNDYELTSAASVSYTEDTAADVVLAEKAKYAITVEPQGATLADLANATFTFTNLNEEGYVYTFTGPNAIALRDGVYSVKVTDSGVFVQQLTSNLKVAGADTTKVIPFSSDITVWDFSAEDFTGENGVYNGLAFSNASKNKTYLLAKDGTISVPVKGPCQIKVSCCYQYSFYFENESEPSVGQKTNSTSQIDEFTYNYNGGAGTVDITVLGTSYITKIEILDVVEYKDTITVGPTGCDFTTINDALDAVRGMTRTDDQRVTIEIQPGNYEEMLVIDVPNVTLKNASSAPSLELTNKGVDIAANAVRITSYYGCGYNYYSMGSDCKYDETILQVNKENGYESFENPGDGSTSGSYWNATVVVSADGFEAEGIIFENSFNQYVSEKEANDVVVPNGECKGPTDRGDLSAGSTAVQDKSYVERAAALAITDNCDKVFFDNCKFIGRQDTLYGGKNSVAAFYDCSVYGACDYIFGGMTAVFAKCDLVFNTSENGNDVGYITAAQTPSGVHGLLMYNCNITSTTPGVDTASEYTSKPGYYGRPWAAATGEAVFYKSVIDASDTNWYAISPSLIRAEGWLSTLSGESALCGEYGTYEYAKDVDNSASRAAWAAVFETETLASGEPITVETWLGDWDAFAGKDMTITMPTEKVDNAPKEEETPSTPGASYVLDTSLDLTAFAQGEKADGDTQLVNDYFTVMYSAKNKVDGSNKTFDDGYTATQRLNFGGKTDPANGMINSVKFETANSATIKIWWVSGGDGREFAIYDKAGAVLSETAEGSVKNTLYISELTVDEAGTYYLGVPTGSNYLFKMEVTEDAAVAEPKEFVLDTSTDLTAFAQGEKADGDTELVKDYFTVMYSAKNKVDGSKKTFDDGYTATQRLNFGGKTDPAKGMINSVKFTTSNSATVKIWWVSGGDGREFAIYDNAGTVLTSTDAAESVKNSLYISELAVDAAGTYYLGVPTGSNYLFKMQVVEDAVVEPKDYILDTSEDLTAFAQGEKADGDTEIVDDFFTVMYSAKNKVDGSKKTFDDGYAATQRLNFGGKTDPAKGMINSVKFTTTGKSTVKIWWVSGGDGREMAIYDASGNVVVGTDPAESVKNSLYISELALEEAGTYYLGVPTGSNYLFKLHVTDGGGAAAEPEAKPWDQVAAPVITDVAQSGGDVTVTVSAVVGLEGADEVLVTMYDAGGNEIATKRSIAEKGEHTITFTPTASGIYTFKATMNREGEEPKVTEENASFAYILPLEAPIANPVTSQGNGAVKVSWVAVDEATGYEVYVDGALVATVAETEYVVTGLTVGQEYTYSVKALRDMGGEVEVSEMSNEVKGTVTAEAQREWGFTTYGSSTSTSSNGYVGSVNEDGQVTVYSEGGKGKIVANSTDGVAFYYTAIPTEENFTLRANVHVDSWTLSNGQEGFGLLATDRLGPNGDATAFWNNQYMAAITKNEYRYDDATGEVYTTSSSLGQKYSMKLGVATIAKTGVTPENLAKLETNDSATVQNEFHSVSDTLELYATKEADISNIVANATKEVAGTSANPISDFVLEIQKNNTGYFVTYYDQDGNIIRQIKNYEPDALSKLDAENVYVGFFAARNGRITVSDIQLTTILASEDAPAEERPMTVIKPEVKITSASNANSENYDVYVNANVDGTVSISVDGNPVAVLPIIGGERLEYPITLTADQAAKVEVVFTPDPEQDLGEWTKLESTDPISTEITVTYSDSYGGLNNLYVAPNGTPDGNGTKCSPLDIYTAVANVQAGQTIILMDGTYAMTAELRIQQGIDGTAEEPIRMIADPDGASRPVLDFQKQHAGISHGGDYWYFRGFDITNSAPGQKGINIGGHYNTLDQINAYNNGNTGIQISRWGNTVPKSEWPSNNLVLNCTAYNNADPGYEDADGFACKLTAGEGNVFDGCVAYNNADDGWDLYAKVETGSIGAVVIKNCVAYQNGYVMENGKLVNAGNGNGFKMGGESISGKHKLINSYAFFNKSKGIDSNSCPDIIVENSTSYNNESYNVALYTNNAANTEFSATGIVSFKDSTTKSGMETGENFKFKGTQDASKVNNETNYFWNGSASTNTAAAQITADNFVSLEFKGVKRNADGTIDLQGFLELKEAGNAGAVPGGNASGNVTVNPDAAHLNVVHFDAVEPGCHSNGNIEYWFCSDCEGFFADEAMTQITNSKSVILPAKGSENLVHFEAIEPGCHSNGCIEYWFCPDCEGFWQDEALTQVTNSKNVILPAIGSENVQHFEAVEPGCHMNGNIEYWFCPECEGYFVDEAQTQITNALSVILPAKGCENMEHFEAVEPTCHGMGNVEHWYCAECKGYYLDEAGTQLTNALSVILPAKGSENMKHVAAVAPTATKDGNVEYWYCEDCQSYYLDEAGTQLTNAKRVILPATGEDDKTNADTGDSIMLFVVLAAVSAMGLAVITLNKKKYLA